MFLDRLTDLQITVDQNGPEEIASAARRLSATGGGQFPLWQYVGRSIGRRKPFHTANDRRKHRIGVRKSDDMKLCASS